MIIPESAPLRRWGAKKSPFLKRRPAGRFRPRKVRGTDCRFSHEPQAIRWGSHVAITANWRISLPRSGRRGQTLKVQPKQASQRACRWLRAVAGSAKKGKACSFKPNASGENEFSENFENRQTVPRPRRPSAGAPRRYRHERPMRPRNVVSVASGRPRRTPRRQSPRPRPDR